jgi:hypothetical protein
MIGNGFGRMRYHDPISMVTDNLETISDGGEGFQVVCLLVDAYLIRFIEALSSKLMEVDPTIPPLPLKDVVC